MAQPHPHHIVVDESGRKTLSIFFPDERPIVVTGDHPAYDRLQFEAEQGDSSYNEIVNYVLRDGGV